MTTWLTSEQYSTTVASVDLDKYVKTPRLDARGNQVLDKNRNPVYDTYCNWYVYAVVKALKIKLPRDARGYMLGATALYKELEKESVQQEYGWEPSTPAQAQANANRGFPTIAVSKHFTDDPKNPNGHAAVVRPFIPGGPVREDRAPVISNAGWDNFSYGGWLRGFGTEQIVRYYSYTGPAPRR